MVRRPSRRAYVGQWIFLLAVIAIGGLLINTLGANLARRNMSFGFEFLTKPAGFDLPFHLLAWSTFDTYARALWVSLLNTLLVSAMSIVSATLLGIFVGVMRLSVNWLVRNLALAFIEFIRNTPQLVQIIFWYLAVLQALPSPRQSIIIPGGLLLNIRGLYVPDVIMRADGALLTWLACFVLAATPFVWHLPILGRRLGAKALALPLIAAGMLSAGIERVE